MLTVPYDEGWEIKVDGKESEYFRIGEALMGLKVGAGEHTIEMKFTPPGFHMGALLSAICVLLYVLSGIWEKRHPLWFAQETRIQDEQLQEISPEEKASLQERKEKCRK